MAITRYESYYGKIREQVEIIRNENEYNTNSLAFAHWYLDKYHKLSEQQIAEAIIDGSDDLGIDAVIIDEQNKVLTVMQFKFPSKNTTINNEIDQGDILKTLHGFKTLIGNGIIYSGTNIKFKEFKTQLQNVFIDSFKMCFVSYNKGIVANRYIIENYEKEFREETGSELEITYHDRDSIGNIYERLNRINQIKITLKYKQMQSAYNVGARKIDSYVGFVSGVDLVECTSSHMATIFDENIRLYEYDSGVNAGINKTATSTDQADMFYFYNNGIVFICDKAKNSPASNEITLEGVSIVNGCQSLNVLYNAQKKGKLNQNVCILIRVIEISDYSERMRITEFLNSQTPIRDSYFIANHPIIRDLQKQLQEKGYYLERQVNEVAYMKERGNVAANQNVIQLENTIQYYVGYWINQYASLAKRGKGALFDKNKIEDLLSGITGEKVIIAMETYQSISEVLTMYRKMRRNSAKQEFADYLGVNRENLLEHIDDFRFMNTGDIVLLNAVANLKNKYESLGLSDVTSKDVIVDAIFIVKQVIIGEDDTNYSGLTKNSGIFSKVQKDIEALTKVYERPILTIGQT